MNKLTSLILLLFVINTSIAQNYINLTIKYSVTGTNSGYDHLTKMRVFIDGNEAGDNTPKKQTIPNSIVVEVPKGNHKIRAVLLAKPENIWEERTKANNYSMDCVFEKTENFIKDKTIELDFDLKKYEVKEKSSTSELYTESSEFLDGIYSSNQTKSNSISQNNYQNELKKLNDYLKTFDNGYYGYLEIKDGYLYDRFKSGEHCKTLIKDLDVAVVEETNRKISVKCKNANSCVFSTYTNSYHQQMSFSQSTDFNTSVLINLFNNFLNAYKNNSSTSNTNNAYTTTNNSSTLSNTEKYKKEIEVALEELNKFLPTLDGGRYKGISIKDDYIYSHYANNNSSKAKIKDLDYVSSNKEYNYVKLACKGDNKCVYSSITSGYHDYFNFNTTSSNIAKTETLLKNLLNAIKNYLGTNSNTISTNTNTSNNNTKTNNTQKTTAQNEREKIQKERLEQNNKTNKKIEEEDDFYWFDEDFDAMAEVAPKTNNTANNNYQTALNNLNNYLKTFNPETYKDVEVKDGKVYFNFKVYGTSYSSYISISELINNTIVLKNKSAGSTTIDEVKIQCKGEKDCFYSTYNKSGADHFRFFSKSVKDFTKMEQLVLDFIKSLR